MNYNTSSTTSQYGYQGGGDRFGAGKIGGGNSLSEAGNVVTSTYNPPVSSVYGGGTSNINVAGLGTEKFSTEKFGTGNFDMDVNKSRLGGGLGSDGQTFKESSLGKISGSNNDDPYKEFRDGGFGSKLEYSAKKTDYLGAGVTINTVNNKLDEKDFRDLSAIKSNRSNNTNTNIYNDRDSFAEDMQPRSYKRQGIQKVIFENHD